MDNEHLYIEKLFQSENFSSPLNISSFKDSFLKDCLTKMLLIRQCEILIGEGRRKGLVKGPVHLGVGQEAIAVGSAGSIRKSDAVFGAHRSHSHILSLGTDLRYFFAEILGRATGLCKGMGGSMHLSDSSVGFQGSVPIVSGTVPLAVGAGMAFRLKKSKNIAVAFFGDGACEEGVVHESLNLASINLEPVIFVVENNLFSSHMHISERQPLNSTARFAKANNIKYQVVDGNDVLEVFKAFNILANEARKGKGPGFIEAITYRWFGHVDWREDIDVGVNRSKIDLEKWRKRDPILRLSKAMINAHIWDKERQNDLELKINSQINQAWEKALKDPYPEKDNLLNNVYSNTSITN